ncbi:gliding motility-associated C-terminal domain-containing protein [Flavobacterium sp.]|uniref:gliding motility-associated C-terminal domain-containing protein n=1 Tax=Flavobacterium sp. TaxID=239 RepID=UPI00286ADF81|nr:gliding motility-associated C-terminal domain-containing protein [Flavobacterium sp.]
MSKQYSLWTCLLILSCLSINAQNLLNNGDFESGSNGVGFSINSCCYNEIMEPFSGSTFTGNYAVTANPQAMNTNFFAGGDHTTGTGKMLIVDGTTTAGGQRFWRAGNNGGGICGLTIGTTYTFSFWIKSVSTQNRANIDHQFVGASNVILFSGSTLAPLPAEGWQQVVYTFTPTNNCVNFELWDTTTTDIGNDFAVDDFSLTGPPQPFTLSYSIVNPSCSNTSDGSIVGYGAGGNSPYVFTLTGPTNTVINGTGIFTGLPAGNYSLNILEGADGEITINNIILTGPQSLTVSNPTTICNGAQTTLSFSGSSSGYTWTASPADNTLTTPNSTNPVVHPNQTTTYTVTSNVSDNTNLVFNGDFSQGNIGFTTNYVYYNPSNPSGLQRAYGITDNSNTWSNFFSNCTDHTSGTGKMLVADGSNVNSGNDKLWCQTIPVTPNQNYTFKYWIQTVALPIPANIAVVINGVSIGIQTASATTCLWEERSYTWFSGANTTAQICIYDRTTDATGNDFAIDDLSFVGPPSVCNLSQSVTITVNNAVAPTFTITNPICEGTTVSPLPTTSSNNIVGLWTPAFNNTATTIYTFNPTPGQCASAVTLELVVTPIITPTFGSVGPFCSGEIISDPLPTISSEGISGNWTPIFNNMATTTYTFTPDSGQCATTTTLEVVIVTANLIPDFNLGPNITSCYNPLIEVPEIVLPTTSNNGIDGLWAPPTLSYSLIGTTVYTFTPNPVNTCVTNFVLKVNIIEVPEFTINAGCDGTDFVLSTDFSQTESTTFTWYNDQNVAIATTPSVIITTAGDYKLVVLDNGCSREQPINIPTIYCKIPKGISPNTDHLNDFFDLSNLNVKQLQIFNRYGTEVYSKSNYKKEWNGTTNSGKELPDGTYYYVINFETGKAKTGWVYINK